MSGIRRGATVEEKTRGQGSVKGEGTGFVTREWVRVKKKVVK